MGLIWSRNSCAGLKYYWRAWTKVLLVSLDISIIGDPGRIAPESQNQIGADKSNIDKPRHK